MEISLAAQVFQIEKLIAFDLPQERNSKEGILVSLFRKRQRSKQSIRKVDLEPNFRDLVIQTARLVALSGYRQVVPLSQNGYYRLFTEAKASVVEKKSQIFSQRRTHL